MIAQSELRKLASERLKDAEALLKAGRFDGAIYLGGYSVELALKNRICKTLKWKQFPQSRSEFQSYQSLKTHDLEVLLSLSGVEEKIKLNYLAEWSAVSSWNPEARYNPIGITTKSVTENFLESVKVLLKAL
jgi:HEPN domain-containing protein